MEHRIRLNLLSTAIVLSLGAVISLITSAVVASRAYSNRAEQTARQEQQLFVKGYARTRVRSDIATWSINVAGEAKQLADTFTQLESATQHVQAFLDEHGFNDSQVQQSAIETDAHYARDDRGNMTRTIESYTLARSFTITTGEVDRAAAAAAEVTVLLKDGVRVHSSPPKYTFSKVGDVKIALLGEASADARQRADVIAAKSDCAVAEVRQA